MTRITSFVIGGASVLICACVSGCSTKTVTALHPHARAETLAQTPHEHYHTVSMSVEQDRRGLAEDLDLLFMTDRPTRLTRWHSR